MTELQWDAPPELSIDVARNYSVSIETNRGDIQLELFPQHAPLTVNNFVFLSGQGFYDGVSFHRVIANFMIQGGDPTGTGSGGPGYRFADECEDNPLKHERCVISMANAGPNTNGSQFFITHLATPHLDGKHTVFGKVTSGEEIVDAIQQGDTMISVKVAG
jgi:peptidyl-prolyl cis-trans isomerase B (cyclophilin B)